MVRIDYVEPFAVIIYMKTGDMLGGYLIQKTLRGRATIMGSKISLTVYQSSTLILCKTGLWYKFKKIGGGGEMGNFGQNLAQNLPDWYMNGSLFLWRLVFVWIQFQIPSGISLRKPNLSSPPPPEWAEKIFRFYHNINLWFHFPVCGSYLM